MSYLFFCTRVNQLRFEPTGKRGNGQSYIQKIALDQVRFGSSSGFHLVKALLHSIPLIAKIHGISHKNTKIVWLKDLLPH